ncbi:MAG: RNA methyltransferase [Mariprofundaceae bacterium]
MNQSSARISIALVHHPVLDRGGETITTAVTSMDVHDFARTCAMYDASPVYFVHPAPGMHAMANDICGYWLEGAGGKRNPGRKQSLENLRLSYSLEEVIEQTGADVWYTSASPPATATTPIEELAGMAGSQLIVFGTGWGLDHHRLPTPNGWLSAIEGIGKVRHLSVRAALAIYLDRLTR